MARGLDARKYFWRSGREKCFSLDIPFYRTSGPEQFGSGLRQNSRGQPCDVWNGVRSERKTGEQRQTRVKRTLSAAASKKILEARRARVGKSTSRLMQKAA